MSDIRTELEKRFDRPNGYIECSDGWDWILEELHEKLLFLDPKYTILQVKEKFATLRFYLGEGGKTKNVAVLLMHDAIRYAEDMSAHTCELCGSCSLVKDPKRGIEYDKTVGLKFSEYGWRKTLCDTCAEHLGYRASNEEEDD